tara:strand:+ start:1660 stop:1815 length:156 start_codon:yes stop_codon:yes gene_type:complete
MSEYWSVELIEGYNKEILLGQSSGFEEQETGNALIGSDRAACPVMANKNFI